MKILVALEMYDVEEICQMLASRTGKKGRYSPSRVQILIKEHLPMAERIGRRYLLTERQIEWLAETVQYKKRPVMY